VCEKIITYLKFVIIPRREGTSFFSRSNAGQALPEDGYRGIPNGAKSNFRATSETLKTSAAAAA
jgi:hypothetical protein